jgi:pimeloyl-ACP methyl ester carboxylesterase
MTDAAAPYVARQPARSGFVPLRRLRHHVLQWGDPAAASAARPPLVLLHGWMDVAASFQFVVDALVDAEDGAGAAPRWILAPDWRGFGRSDAGGGDSYWFPDYLADLDALLGALCPAERFAQVDLLGHSMGGNVAMSYAGVRPQRIRRLVNLEGFGLPRTRPEQAPQRLAQWLDELRAPATLRSYTSLDEVAARLMQNNPRLGVAKAAWLAPHWAAQREDGRWHILGDPAHKRSNPVLYRVEEILAGWRCITAPVLWVEGEATDVARWWGTRYTLEEFRERLAVVRQVQSVCLRDAGHMLHHDQPQALAAALAAFLR